MTKLHVLEALRSLQRRSLLAPRALGEHGSAFGLQNVVAEYIIGYLIDQACHEFECETPALLHTHPLILADAKEYVRQSQERVVLQPIGERLLARYGPAQLVARCQQLLEAMRRDRPRAPSFLAGNLLNVLRYIQLIPRDLDVSELNVWGAYLRGSDLPAVDFSQADLTGSVFTDYVGAVISVALSPDGRLLAAGADTGAIYIWRTLDHQLVGICHGHTSHVWSLAFGGMPGVGGRLLSGSADMTVRVWDVERRQTLHVLTGHTGVVSTVGFHPDGALVVSGSLDETVRLWDAQSGQLLGTLQAGATRVEATAFSPDGRLLATAGHDQLVRLWDWRRAEVLHTLRGQTNLVKALAFCPTPEGQGEPPLLASGGDDQTLRLWDTQTGALLATLSGHTAAIISMTASADGAWLFSGSDDQTVRVWDLSRAWVGAPGEVQTARVLHGHAGTMRSLSVRQHQATRQTLLASGSYDKTVRLWDVQRGEVLAIMRGHAKWLQSLAFTAADGPLPDRLLVAGSDGQSVRVWDGETGRALHTLRGHTGLTEKIAVRADGAQLASAGWDGTARIWSLQTGQTQHVLGSDSSPVATMAFGAGPRGRLLASGGHDRCVRLWDGETGEALASWSGHHDRVVALAFSDDGTMLASGSWDSSIGVWDTQRDALLCVLRGHTETVESVAFHPNGALLASASCDRSVQLWDVRTAKRLHRLEGHSDGLEMVVFSPDGALLASCGCDHLVCVWDVHYGQLRYTLCGHSSWVRCIGWSPDGRVLASGSDDGTVKLWDVTLAGAGSCQKTIALDHPYTGMRIGGVVGLSAAQKVALKALGAVDEPG